jgi:hypothetical protein
MHPFSARLTAGRGIVSSHVSAFTGILKEIAWAEISRHTTSQLTSIFARRVAVHSERRHHLTMHTRKAIHIGTFSLCATSAVKS